jgi:hypothetical protein
VPDVCCVEPPAPQHGASPAFPGQTDLLHLAVLSVLLCDEIQAVFWLIIRICPARYRVSMNSIMLTRPVLIADVALSPQMLVVVSSSAFVSRLVA